MTIVDPLELCRALVARAADGEEVEVCAGRSVRTEVRVHDGDVESLTVAEAHGIGVRVVRDGREGHAHAGSFDAGIVDTLLADARDNAEFAEPDERVGLAEPDGVVAVELDPWAASVGETSVDEKIELAVELERAVRSIDPRVRGVRTSIYADSSSEQAIVSTLGVDAADRATMASLSTTALIDEPDGGTRTGSAVDAAHGPDGLDPDSVAQLAVERGVQLLGATAPSTGRTTVVLEPRFTATVLGIAAGMLSGERVVKGRTPFADRQGEPIAADRVTMHDDPTDAGSLGASPIDGEGLATRPVALLADGVLTGFLHDSRSARGLGVRSTGSALRAVRGIPGPGHRALHVAPGAGDLASLIADIDDGLVVCSLQGLHSGVNAVSGDFSVGVEGIRIRGGRLAEPVREGTLAGAVPRMLLDIVAVGSDLDALPSGAVVPSIVIEGLMLGGDGS